MANNELRKNELERLVKIMDFFVSAPMPKDAIGYGQGQKRIIRYLVDKPKGVSPSDLALHCLVGSGRIGNALKELESKGIIKRENDPKDKRKTIVKLTKKGNEYHKAMESHFIKRFNKLLDVYGEERFASYLALSEEMIKDLGKIAMEEETCLKPIKI